MFDGTVKSLPCSVEDFVFDNFDTTKGQQVAAGINNIYRSYLVLSSQGSSFNDKYVVFNYGEVLAVLECQRRCLVYRNRIKNFLD